jgi:hypothetical protein
MVYQQKGCYLSSDGATANLGFWDRPRGRCRSYQQGGRRRDLPAGQECRSGARERAVRAHSEGGLTVRMLGRQSESVAIVEDMPPRRGWKLGGQVVRRAACCCSAGCARRTHCVPSQPRPRSRTKKNRCWEKEDGREWNLVPHGYHATHPLCPM